jgi:hypothetical protein
MPVEGNVYAAFITELEQRLQLDGKAQFLAFPEFLLRIGLDDLLFEARAIQERTGLDAALAQREALLNQEGLAVLVNQVPEASSTFLTDGQMLWSVYERVISAPELPTRGEDDADALRAAQSFQALRASFALAERDSLVGDGARFYATGVLPPNDVTDADGWTRVALDRPRIDQRSRESSPATRSWLEQRGLLDGVEGAGVQMTSLSAEVFPLTLQRPWFAPEVFRSRLWRWGEAPLSDGGDPPRGLLPAYITRLVLVRKLQIELDVAPAAAAPGAMVQFALGFRPTLLTMLAPQAAAAEATPSPRQLLARTRDKSQALNLRQFVKMTMSQEPSGKRSLDLRPLGSLAVSFPAPVAFLSRPILDRIAAEQGTVAHDLARLTAERTALQGQGAGLEQQVERLEGQVRRYPESVHTVTIRDHRGGGAVRESILDVDALRRQLADLKRSLQGIQAEMARLDQAVAIQTRQADDLQELQQYDEMLSRAGDDADIFVLGFVCSATPKSPDPDPALFP